ncbi:MAG: hypothetical protein KI786_06420 [Mameliella sp.]|nr:hypothetical protein [Phaeodactylibacter sp.]
MRHFITLFLLTFIIVQLNGQGILRHNLDSTGTTYVKASLRAQIWGRYTQMNPGTVIYGEPTSEYFDVSIRRLRMNFSGQLTPELYVYAGFGNNNLSYRNSKDFQIGVLDLYAEYQFHKAIAVGFGKSGYHGLSRLNLRSSRSMLGLDAPLFSLYSVNRTDHLGRNLGIWMKGQIGPWDYRAVVNNPLQYDSGEPGLHADWSNIRPRPRWSFYLKHQFADRERNTAFGAGTYLGKKKIFNLGAGFAYQSRAMWTAGEVAPDYHDMLHFAADLYVEWPVFKGAQDAFTAYVGYFNFDFGPGYLRNVGANNPATGLLLEEASFNGTGAAFPMIGNGQVLFWQTGYLLPKSLTAGIGAQLQPNLSVEYARYDRLSDPMMVYELAVNLLFDGHRSKMTLGAQNRPVFNAQETGIFETDRLWMAVLQYQIEIN